MKASDLCSRNPITVKTSDTVAQAAELMRQFHVGALIVVDPEQPSTAVGVLTDRDLVVSLLAHNITDLEQLSVGEVIDDALAVVGANDSIDSAIRLMHEVGVRRLPVIDGHNNLVGMLTYDDILVHIASRLGMLADVVGTGIGKEADRRP